jgi:hypothetical protein
MRWIQPGSAVITPSSRSLPCKNLLSPENPRSFRRQFGICIKQQYFVLNTQGVSSVLCGISLPKEETTMDYSELGTWLSFGCAFGRRMSAGEQVNPCETAGRSIAWWQSVLPWRLHPMVP